MDCCNIVLMLVFAASIISLESISVRDTNGEDDQCDLGEGGQRLLYAHSECYICQIACMAKELDWVDNDGQIILKPVLEFFYPKEHFPDSHILLENFAEDCHTLAKEQFSNEDLCKRMNVLALCAFNNIDNACPGSDICSGPKPKYSTLDKAIIEKCKTCPPECYFTRVDWVNHEGVLDIQKVASSVPEKSILIPVIQGCQEKYNPIPNVSIEHCSYSQKMSSCMFDGYYKACNKTLWGPWRSVTY